MYGEWKILCKKKKKITCEQLFFHGHPSEFGASRIRGYVGFELLDDTDYLEGRKCQTEIGIIQSQFIK